MPKLIKEPVYREILECENCGEHWIINSSASEFCKCWVCKKEGCGNCSSWMSPTGKKYYYHFKCKEGLPKNVLREMQAQNDKYDRQQAWSDYVIR